MPLLVQKIYEITRNPEFWNDKDLLYGMRKYATSSAANIAEAHQLYIPRKFKFFNNALEALNGLDSLLDTSISKKIVTEERLRDIRRLRESIRNILIKRLANISKEKAG